jgi:hypothetical protein
MSRAYPYPYPRAYVTVLRKIGDNITHLRAKLVELRLALVADIDTI